MVEKSRLPSLDLLKGFEAAARSLSFTKAAAELFVTQSAVSRQVIALERQLGVALFQRRHRALLLTEQGQMLYRAVADALRLIGETTTKLRSASAGRVLTVSTSIAFASLWLIPRLSEFRAAHPGIDVRISANNEIIDLTRDNVDVAIRYCMPKTAPVASVKLFGEQVFPICARALTRERSRPLKTPQDLRHHVLLRFDDARTKWPWLDWSVWFEVMRIADVQPAGTLYFSHYDQVIQAAIDGQGVALGRRPLVNRLIERGRLLAPFDKRYVSSREYFAVISAGAALRPDAGHFVEWLRHIAQSDSIDDQK